MKIQKQPDYLIFADSAKKGENTDFPDINRGWGITIEQTASKPPMEWMNGAFNRIDKNMLYLLQQGVPEWSELVTYPVNAIIKYNGVLYTAIAENDNAKPSTNTTTWKKTQAEILSASTTQKGIVQLSSATDSESETEAVTPLVLKRVNDLLQSISVKYHCYERETRMYSGDRKQYIFTRDDGYCGFVGADGQIKWAFDSNGSLVIGDIPANNVKGLSDFIVNMFSSSSNENAGFLKMPNGLIIQWGRVLYGNNVVDGNVNGEDKSFYTAFPRVCLSIVSSDEGSGANSTGCWPLSTTQFRCWGRTHKGSYSQTGIFYIAIGF
ncbi:phage tail protein [Gilliamella apicola]|uniref:phage tail protein n=1 Tax=Gilliamella sp. wkB112 TaxID=3120257 RepID=UPI00080D99A0|nr:phage tail protein [Gilliamella apicola]OCG02277.1 hypothetical protein A9G12_11255 [Gilliamella apicola]